MYYLRARPASDPIKFTLDMEALMDDVKDTGGVTTEGMQGNYNK